MRQKGIDLVYGAVFAVLYGLLCPWVFVSHIYLLYLFLDLIYILSLGGSFLHMSARWSYLLFFLCALCCYVGVHLWKVSYWRRHEKRLIHTLLEVILPMAMFYPVLMLLSFVAASFLSSL